MGDDSDSEFEEELAGNNNKRQTHERDRTDWRRSPNTTRTQSHNIIRHSYHGPVRSTQMRSALHIFKNIFTDVMYNVIIKETNRKANSVYSE